ncbi:MAG: hypothetical protein QM689_01995 [Oscillospiraceae bacterium]
MTDVYKEQIVKKIPNESDRIKKLCIILGTISLAGILFFVVSAIPQLIMIYLLAVGGMIYGDIYLMAGMSVEYEYILTNGEIDIDKIIGQRKRKRLVTFRLGAALSFGKLESEQKLDPSHTVIDASGGGEDETYFVEISDKTYGAAYVLVSPNEELLELMRPFLPKTARSAF